MMYIGCIVFLEIISYYVNKRWTIPCLYDLNGLGFIIIKDASKEKCNSTEQS